MKNSTVMHKAAVVLMVVCLFSLSVFTGSQEVYATGNQAPTVTEKMSRSINLNGIDAAVTGAVPLAPRFTAEVWAKSGTDTWNDDGFLISARSGNGFILHPVIGTKTVNVYIVGFNGMNETPFQASVSFHVDDIMQWHHYAVVYDIDSVRLYLDGNLVATSAIKLLGRWTSPHNGNVYLGKDPVSSGTRFGNVEVDEVRIWNYARKSEDITLNKDRRLYGNESGLVLYWNFESIQTSPPSVNNLAQPGQVGSIEGSYAEGTRVLASQPIVFDEGQPGLMPSLELTDSDAASPSDPYSMSLSAAKGRLSFASTVNLTLISGADHSALMIWRGTMDDLNTAMQSLTYQPNANQYGADTLTVTVTDSGSASTTYLNPIMIHKINEAPSFDKGTDLTVEEGAERQVISGWATNISPGPNEIQNLTFLVSSDKSYLFLEQPAVDSSGTLTFQPMPDVNGSAIITVILKDDGGRAQSGVDTAIATFTITVNRLNMNYHPTISLNHALHFDGSSNSVKVSALPMGRNFTAEVWARSSTPVWNESGVLLSSRGGNGFIMHPNKDTKTMSVYFMKSGGTTEYVKLNISLPVDITQWHHYAISYFYDEDNITVEYNVYLDGQRIYQYVREVDTFRSLNKNINLFIGQDDDTSLAYAGKYGHVDIDEVRVWDRKLSDAEIRLNYNRKLSGNEPGLKLNLDMEQVIGDIVPDLAGGDNNGTLIGVQQSVFAPPLNMQPEEQTANEDTTIVNSFGEVGDVDTADTTLTVQLSATHGNVHIPATSGLTLTAGENDSKLLAYSGVVADLNAALQNVGYQPDGNYNGTDSVTLTVTDTGNGGTGLAKSASQSYSVQVRPVNDAPLFTKGADQYVVNNVPAQAVADWATNISAGATDEASQGLTYLVNNDHPELFTQQPSVDSGGTLHFTPKADASGTATVAISLKDDGGTANGGGDTSVSQSFTISVGDPSPPPSSMKNITAYSFAGMTPSVTGLISGTNISLTVPSGTDVTSLIATFTNDAGSTVKVGSTPQISGTTLNDFTSPVLYVVTAADNSTQTYTVTVTVAPTPTPPPSSAKNITAYSFAGMTPSVTGTISGTNISLTVPSETDVTSLIATFANDAESTVKVGSTPQISGMSHNDFTLPVTYVVTAADNSTQTYTVTVTVAPAPPQPPSSAKNITAYSFASIMGTISGTNISLTVPSGTDVTSLIATFTNDAGSTVKVGSTPQISGTTPNDFTSPVLYVVTAADSSTQTYTVIATMAPAPPPTPSSAKNILAYSFAGIMGTISGTTISLTVPSETDVTSLIATFTIDVGSTVKVDSTPQISGTTPNDFTSPVLYVVTAADNSTQTYTVTVTMAPAPSSLPSSAKNILAYSFAGIMGTISGTTISLTVPSETDVTSLIATFTNDVGSTVKVGSTPQISGTTHNDFTSPVTYVVTAADNSTQTYTVTVTMAPAPPLPLSSAKNITAYSFAGIMGTISGTNISLTVPSETDVTSLIATFTNDVGSTVKVGSTPQISGTTPNDFTSPVTYVVTAADNSTQTYTVTVTMAPANVVAPPGPTSIPAPAPIPTSAPIPTPDPTPTPISTDDEQYVDVTVQGGAEAQFKDFVKLSIPTGSVPLDGKIKFTVVPDDQVPEPPDFHALSQVFEFISSTGDTFKKPVKITFKYDVDQVISGNRAAVYYYNELLERWIYLGGTVNADGTITIYVNHFTKFAVYDYEPKPFLDLGGHWAMPYIERLIGMEVVEGYPNQMFRPEEALTRAQFATILAKALGISPFEGATNFADDAEIPSWSKGDVAALVEAGFIHGYSENGEMWFRANQTITRAEMSVIIAKALNTTANQTDSLVVSSVNSANSVRFKDASSIPTWARASVDIVVSATILSGYGDDTFRSSKAVTRAEAAAMIYKLLESLHI
ncbi:hypothetical protein EHS13_04245 [Paenibacillus psychroresistens]|uniref:SLH domain-containing protein n=1 Tax=Paenibacillus psychroresistens TaxID=1778678 RepID=A0A6B8RFB3_9BACL|nr:S-layer homology domain-containing protein [Paenibacillus psychroresistens]QGQ94172.1 hypothetical protein EHS13_04245 [Paenibacillus psychroresistens]